MIEPRLPENETARMKCVKESGLLDTLPESDFDNITELVSTICNVPISLIGHLCIGAYLISTN